MFVAKAQAAGGGVQVSAGTTSLSSGTLVFSNANGVSFGLDGSTLTASAAAGGGAAISAGTQSGNTGTIVFSNSNGVSFGMSGSTRVTASVDAIKSISAGTTRITNGEAVFSNLNGVSFGADGQTVTGSVGAGATATGNFGAIAAGTQTATSGTIVFSDSNQISFGLSGSTRVTATFAAIKSISAGTTRATNGEVIFSNSNGVSFGMDAGTVTGSVSEPTLNMFWPHIIGGSAGSSLANGTLNIYPFPAVGLFPGKMTLSTLFMDVSGSISTGAAFTKSVHIGFYTAVNGTQLSLVFSASTSIGTSAADTSIIDMFSGIRWLTFHSSQFNVQPTLSQTNYWMALIYRSSSGSGQMSFLGYQTLVHSVQRSGFMNAVSSNNASLGYLPFVGVLSVSTSALPGSIGMSDLNRSVDAVRFYPKIHINNLATDQ